MNAESTPFVVPVAASPDHEIVSGRTMPYARRRIFAAWTHPDLHAKWWGPAGFANTFYDYDVRPGGHWRFTMHGPNGTAYENECVFEHVVDGECLVFKHLSEPNFTIVATFAEADEGTRVEFRMIFADADTCAAVKHYAAGKNEENFDRLEALLKVTPVDAPIYRELALLRTIDAAPEVVWRALTTRVTEWWCPVPWRTTVAEWDLRSGGRMRTVMEGPAGEVQDMDGLLLEVVENQRLVFTDALQQGWHPTHAPFMIGVFELTRTAEGKTAYRASARHWSDEKYAEHEAMGFRQGWGAVADQLIAVVADEQKRHASA